MTGLSYGGVYAPYLAWQIHQWNLEQKMYGLSGFKLEGFIVGNGITDMYIDSDNPLIESLAYWSMIPMKLWQKIKSLGCIFYWKKMDVEPNNPP